MSEDQSLKQNMIEMLRHYASWKPPIDKMYYDHFGLSELAVISQALLFILEQQGYTSKAKKENENKTQISCPNWGNVKAYEDCEACPSFDSCESETMIRLYNPHLMSIRLLEFRDKISKLWSEETKYPKSKENGFNATSRGQCYVTTFVAWTEFGGEIMKGKIDDEDHYWNNLLNYGEIDFTSDQYGGNDMATVTLMGEIVKTRDWNNPRVKLLLEKYRASCQGDR